MEENGGFRSGGIDQALEARLQARRRERESRTTEMFEVPGHEDIFKVEMQVLGFRRTTDIELAQVRVKRDADRVLYTCADQVLAATVGFWLIEPDGSLAKADGIGWVDIARAEFPEMDATVRPRTALIRLLNDGNGVKLLHAEWNAWNQGGNVEVDEALVGDFPVTE
jgi:hypothetical protein